MSTDFNHSSHSKIFNALLGHALGGVGPMTGARELAQQYIDDPQFHSAADRTSSLIRWETTKNFSTGFLSGLGGFITLPVTIPGAVAASLAIHIRLVATIAILNGYDPKNERIKTMILICLCGSAGHQILRKFGVKLGEHLGRQAIQAIPRQVILAINRALAMRLITKAGERGVVNLTKLVPILGGIIGGSIDACMCQSVAKIALRAFPVIPNDNGPRGVPVAA